MLIPTQTCVTNEAWLAWSEARAYGIMLDPYGKIAWGRAEIDGDPNVVMLSGQVRDPNLPNLRTSP
jgi:hypothetical protein